MRTEPSLVCWAICKKNPGIQLPGCVVSKCIEIGLGGGGGGAGNQVAVLCVDAFGPSLDFLTAMVWPGRYICSDRSEAFRWT